MFEWLGEASRRGSDRNRCLRADVYAMSGEPSRYPPYSRNPGWSSAELMFVRHVRCVWQLLRLSIAFNVPNAHTPW